MSLRVFSFICLAAIGYLGHRVDAASSDVVWVDRVNTSVTGDVLQKSSGCDGCFDAGAVSQQQIASGDGYVEFTIGETHTFFVAGLSHGNTGTDYAEIDFAFRFNGAGWADVLENGTYAGGDASYAAGDVFRVTLVGEQVRFSRNGIVLLERPASVTYPLVLDTALASAGATIRSAHLASVPKSTTGGFLEKAGSQTYRARFTPSQIASFLPANGATGRFTFPAPYNTQAVRLTSAADCSDGRDCLWPVGYSYWRSINNHVGSDTMYIVLGFDRDRGGAGPSLIAYNKTTDAVQNLGALFTSGNAHGYSSTEGWYFSATSPSRLYVFLPGDTALRRFDVVTRQFETTPALDLNACPRPSVCPGDAAFIYQPHSSDDDRVHSVTVQDASFQRLGCLASDSSAFVYVPVRPGYFLDECHVDKSGRWLLVLEAQTAGGLDNRIIDLSTGVATVITDVAGALGHLDTGFGYAIGADNYNPLPNASILLKFPLTSTERPVGPVVHFNKRWDIAAANHIAHGNALAGRPPEEQYACGSNASRVADMADEIVCFSLNPSRHADGSLDVLVVGQVMTDLDAPGGNDLDGDDYKQLPKGNLDVTGRYFIWTANLGGNRLDAFIVKVPGELLAPTNSPPAPINGAPLASDVSARTTLGTPVTITLNATDAETCELGFAVAQMPTSGTVGPISQDACVPGAPNQDSARTVYTPAAAGTYTFTYRANDVTTESNVAVITVTVDPAPLRVTSIQPNVVTERAGTVTFIVAGAGFAPGAGLTFQDGDGPAPRVRNVTRDSSTQLTAIVEIRAGGPRRDRLWDVRVTNPDGSANVGVDLLRITP